MNILLLGDLHGKLPKMPKSGFEAIICTGDYGDDKGIRKVVEKSRKIDKPISELITKKKWNELIKLSREKAKKLIQRLDKKDHTVFTIPGNWDTIPHKRSSFDSLYLKNTKNIHDCHKIAIETEEFVIIGYGFCGGPEIDFEAPVRERKKQIKEFSALFGHFESLFEHAADIGKPVIFLSHNAPINSKLDKVRNNDSIMNGKHVGSMLTRQLIDAYQPAICICGHVHESVGKQKIGKTLVTNCGYQQAWMLDTKKKQVTAL
ncbi:MAG: Icc-related predicted phosphoesterase [Candidatus Woesearchaeota archaeon]|jgi:Icc-related predicted phosphoesterase